MLINKTELFKCIRSLHNIKNNDLKYLIHEFILIEKNNLKKGKCIVCKLNLNNENEFVCLDCFNVLYYKVDNQLNNIILTLYKRYALVKSGTILPSVLYDEISKLLESKVFENTCYKEILLNLAKITHLLNMKRMHLIRKEAQLKMLFITYKALKIQYTNVLHSNKWDNLLILHTNLEDLLKEINEII